MSNNMGATKGGKKVPLYGKTRIKKNKDFPIKNKISPSWQKLRGNKNEN